MYIKYRFYENEQSIVEKINSLEKMIKELPSEMKYQKQTICFEDLFIMSAVDKSLKLIDSFMFAFKNRNITVLAALTRIQMDCVLRTFATTLVKDSSEFCKRILFEEQRIDKEKSISGEKLTDNFLCRKFESVVELPVLDLYQKVCGYVHFSASSLHNSVHSIGNDCFVMKISKYNQEEYVKIYERLSIELANHFFYFGRILIEGILKSWWQQKKELYDNN